MRFGRNFLATSLLVATSMSGLAMTHSRRGPTSQKLFNKHAPKPTSRSSRSSGQRAIDDNRATAIQTALIKQGYLSGEATGHWDSQTESAMQKMQADNGWQTKLIPDSRAIIKLGLGPNQSNNQASINPSAIPTR
jgi:Putative peptidoglycan binding domain